MKGLEVLKSIIQKSSIKYVTPENTLSEEAKNEINKIKEIEKMVDREWLYYRINEYTFNFQNLWTLNTFLRDI